MPHLQLQAALPENAVAVWSAYVRAISIVACLAGMVAHSVGAVGAEPYRLADGTAGTADLSALQADGSLQLLRDNVPVEIPASSLLYWGAWRPNASSSQLLLVGDDLLVGEIVQQQDDSLELRTGPFGPVKVPLEWLHAVIVHPPVRAAPWDQLIARAHAGDPAGDLLLMRQGDELPGRFIDLSTGESPADLQVKFESRGNAVKVPLERTQAMLLDVGLAAREMPVGVRYVVGFSDGSLLTTDRLALNEDVAEFSVGSLELSCAAVDIVFLMPLGQGKDFLSDLAEVSYKHVPFLQTSWPLGKDRNAEGGRLRTGDNLIPKGLGMHSASRVTYAVSKTSRLFAADIALDDATGNRGSVSFRVFLDNKEAYRSPLVRGGDAPMPVRVELGEAKTLSLVVDFGERGDERDLANWLWARFVD